MIVDFQIRTTEVIHHEEWDCHYTLEVHAQINTGSKGDDVTPGEDPFIEEGSLKAKCFSVDDDRFKQVKANASAILIVPAEVTQWEVGSWVLMKMGHFQMEALKEKILERWESSKHRSTSR